MTSNNQLVAFLKPKGVPEGFPLDRISILGTGLIGGSVGLALKAAVPGLQVIGYDIERASAEAAVTRGAIDQVALSVEDASVEADLVLLCMPVDLIPGTLGNWRWRPAGEQS